MVFEDINISDHLNLLHTGANVLAIQGLNKTAGDLDFLIVPELADLDVTATGERYFATPSPGWANASQYVAFVADTKFDVDRGFYTAAFDLHITSDTAGATIRYTTDSSTPTETYGTIYNPATGIHISGTTTLRAIACKTGYESSNVDTETYLFLADVITQSPLGQAPGPGWPTGSVNGQILDYGMDPDVVNDPQYASLLLAALTQVPTISLVTDLPNLFNPSTGIYVNAGQDGADWERAASVELINFDGSDGFQINAGLRIRGGYSRTGDNPKHAFRLLFDEKYGASELKFPLFGDDGVDTFKNIDLRTSQNYSWSFGGDSQNIMVRDLFSRELQAAMEDPYTRSQFVQLYVDGQYWGLYMTEERPEADYAASYFGGDNSDYDVVKVDTNGYVMFATDGTMDAFQQLYNAAVAGFSSNTAYYHVMGLDANGAPDPGAVKLLDPVNLADYMISIYYSGDLDASLSNFIGNSSPNNTYCIFDRVNPDGFKFFRHDA
ncbi:MAG: CotH kinase family protein, partial [Planctomycetota bacterium]|nr:CotH kinase family protein [Planctomycetota bacterium]